MLRYGWLVAVLWLGPAVRAQVTAGLAGHVTDADTHQPLVRAAVDALLADSVIGTSITDTAGHYRFDALIPGVITLHVRHQGSAPVVVPEVWVRAGRTETVDVEMAGAGGTLHAVEVTDVRPRRMDAIGERTITVEQTLRYPATFFDPVRTVDTHAGIARTNDQANHFSVRGNGPGSNAWLLEGAEIVTPNHLTNAGTASDLPVLSGGGVTILSTQMLGTSRLLMGSPDVAYGDALGGIMDMRLRKGTNDRAVHTVQAGLIGIDLATEGPFKKGGASYLVNYRYSTVGLLGLMGVNLGDEAITFQDLSFHVSLPFKRGSISLFGLGGLSTNRFKAVEDSTRWVYDKDSQNIDYAARMGAAGGTMRMLLGRKAVWTLTAVLSEQDQQRDADGIHQRGFVFSTHDRLDERKLSMVSHVRGTLGDRVGYQVGGSAMERVLSKSYFVGEAIAGWLVRPYAQANVSIGKHVRAVVGLAASYWSESGSAVPEPRLSITWDVGRRDVLMLAAGQRSQLPPLQNYQVFLGSTILDNRDIGLIRSQDVSLAAEHAFTEHLFLRAELFAQRLLDVPVIDTTAPIADDLPHGFSMANEWDGSVFSGLAPYGTARNCGVELSLQQRFHRGLYYHVNGTLLDARNTDAYGNGSDSRWNTGFIANLVIGKEFIRRKEKSTRTWGVHLRANAMGGQHYMPAPDEGKGPWEDRYATYHRIDLRVYLRREHPRRTGMWALDLQNALNTRNQAFQYYDVRQGAQVMRYQLGLIPNLSYRIEF